MEHTATSSPPAPADLAGHATTLIRAVVIGAGLFLILSAIQRAGRF